MQSKVGNHKRRTLNTRLSSGTSAGTFTVTAGPYISNKSNINQLPCRSRYEKQTWHIFGTNSTKGVENRSSHFEPKISLISFSMGSGSLLTLQVYSLTHQVDTTKCRNAFQVTVTVLSVLKHTTLIILAFWRRMALCVCVYASLHTYAHFLKNANTHDDLHHAHAHTVIQCLLPTITPRYTYVYTIATICLWHMQNNSLHSLKSVHTGSYCHLQGGVGSESGWSVYHQS